METLSSRLRANVARDPASPFCTLMSGDAVVTITYGDLYQNGLSYARLLRERGVGRGDIVPIILQHGPHLMYAFVGAILAGAIPSFLPFPSAKQRTDLYWRDHIALFERLEPRLVISYGELIKAASEVFGEERYRMLEAHDGILVSHASADQSFEVNVRPDDIACLQHSSGTTGLKKGVMLTHRAVLQHVEVYSKTLRFTSGDSIVSWLPLYHDMGFIACFMGSLVRGTHLIAMDPFEWVMRPSLLLEAISRYKPTFCWLPNFAFTHLVRTARRSTTYDLSSIRAFINCSEPCKVETFERFLVRFAAEGADASRVGVCYAMAENVFAVSQTPVGRAFTILEVDAAAFLDGRIAPATSDSSKRLLSCGPPVGGVEVRVADAAGRDMPPGVIGELHVRSPFMFSGYYLQPEITERRLRGGWYATGDMGFVHGGDVYVTGRVDDMLIINGRNFYAHEIEAIVNDIEGIIPGRSVAIGVDDDRSDGTAVVVLAETRVIAGIGDDVQRRVKREVLDRLGLALHAFVDVPAGSLIKTTSGKISRVENKKRYMESRLSEQMG